MDENIKVINDFIENQDIADITKERYRNTLKIWHDYLIINGIHCKTVSRPDILNYKIYLQEKGRSFLTISTYISVIKKYYKWLYENDLFYKDIGSGIVGGKRYTGFRRKPLSEKQIYDLLNSIDHSNQRGIKNFIIINLMLFMGLRVIEVVRLNVEDFVKDNGSYNLLILGKGKVYKQFMGVPDFLSKLIIDYIGDKKEGALFFSSSNHNKNGRLSTRGLSIEIKKCFRNVGIDEKDITAHSLRHTTAIMMMKKGLDIYAVKNYLRHTDINMSLNYLRYYENEKRINNNWGEDMYNLIFKGKINEN